MKITLHDYLTSSEKYPDRQHSPDCTAEVKSAACALLEKVNALLAELSISNVKVSSGFRTAESNAKTPNAAKRSKHMSGHAIDLQDLDEKLDNLFLSNLDKLEKHGLYIEAKSATPKWCHLQDLPPKSGSRSFNP